MNKKPHTLIGDKYRLEIYTNDMNCQTLIKMPPNNKHTKPVLKDNQAELLGLFLMNETISYEDVNDIWVKYFSNNGYWWISSIYEQDKNGMFVSSWKKMPESIIRQRTFCWLRSCIGTLVLKGYLKVIPNFDFEY